MEHVDGSGHDIDRALRDWGRWRDKDAAEHYWFATDMGKAGALDTVVPEIQSRLLGQHKIDVLMNLFTHRSRPSEVFTPARLLGATGRLLRRPGCQRRKLLREVGALMAQDLRRRRLNRWPVHAAAGTALDAGPTEAHDSAAAMTIGAD